MVNRLKNNGIIRKCILVLFIAGAFSACDEQTVYHAFRSIPQAGWQRQDTLLFDVPVPDSLTYYKLSVELRNRTDYPYQNISLSVCYDGPEVHPMPADTIQITLADKEGIWKGDGWGGLYQSASFVGGVKIGKPGHYLFKIAYTLPDGILPGINDVGIKLER